MYYNHFGLNEPPFRITPHTDFFFSGANRGATLDALIYAILHDEGIVKVSGEVGSGKTMLCRVLMERLPESVETIYLANPSLSRDEILYAISEELGIDLDVGGRTTRLLRALQNHLIQRFAEGRRVVVLIDEAHAMPRESLEEIRLLSNLESDRHKLLQIVMFGQPELDAQLNTEGMRQLKERITHGFRLEPMVRADIESYIEFRMRAAGYRGPNAFTPGAIKLIARSSAGLTRRVNILADKSLLAAFATNKHGVTVREVRRAIRDSEFYRPVRRSALAWVAAGALVAGLAIGLGAHLLSSREPSIGLGPQSPRLPVRTPETPVPDAENASRPPMKTSEPDSRATSTSLTSQSAVKPSSAAPVSAPPAAPNMAPAKAPAKAPAPVPRTQSGSEKLAPPPLGKSSYRANPVPPARGKIVQERFAVTQGWLKSAPGDHYAVQLLTVRDSKIGLLEDFLRRASTSASLDDFHVYSVKINGSQYYRLTYGLYPSSNDSLAAMRDLPISVKGQNPFHRSVERMRSQNRQ
ncbi:MAG: AAA family ATPase [Betaproteobacteria bacterium]|nr:AAA family ATPase [Betaproteobacteria bacterium]